MSTLQAFILGLVQGLGEFLPISSSGHLTLVQTLFSIPQDGSMALEVMLHVGTLIAVFVVYWKRIWGMICHPLRSELKLLVVATIPAVVAKLLFEDFFEMAFTGAFLGFSFVITTIILCTADILARITETHKDVGWKDAIVMGCMQAVAILPGVSRSGSTIAGGIATGLTRKRAADFSFIMSIPAILGGLVLELKGIVDGSAIAAAGGAVPVLVGVIAAAVFGFIAIRVMLYAVRRISLKWFGLYTGILGLLVIIDQFGTHFFFK